MSCNSLRGTNGKVSEIDVVKCKAAFDVEVVGDVVVGVTAVLVLRDAFLGRARSPIDILVCSFAGFGIARICNQVG